MKNLIILLLSLCLIITSCKQDQKDKDIALIDQIENNLLPNIIIKGDTLETYNIIDRMNYYNIPGASIAFLNEGKIKWAKGYGHLSVNSEQAVNENTLFQAASISKPVAAMASLHLVEQDKLGLDDDVNIYLKDWKVEENSFTENEKVSLRRILSHNAGLTVHGFGGYSSTDTVPDIIEVLNGEKPANSPRIYPDTLPGAIYRYSGGGYTVMQKMLTDISGMGFPELMEKYVLSKAGMKNSTYKQPLPDELSGNAASGHKPDGSMVPGKWHTYPEMAAAGLWTTASDLLKYAIEVQNSLKGEANNIISKEMTEEMLRPQANSHGLGPAVNGEGETLSFSHGGANEGFRCQLFAFASGPGVAVMTNSDNGGALTTEIMRSFANVYGWPVNQPVEKSTIDMDEDIMKKYEGDYLFIWQDEEMIINLKIEGNHLIGLQKWDDVNFKIYPESELKFFSIDDGASFEFVTNDDNEIIKVIIQEQYHFEKQQDN